MQDVVNPWRVLAKGVVIFVVFEAALYSSNLNLGRLDVYAQLGLARSRFPTSTEPSVDAALDVGNLDAMFASHIISRPKAPGELRVVVLGDSAVWGFLLQARQTLPGQLDSLGLTCGDKNIRVYNLSYPRSSATKDLMILDKAMQYDPDVVVWIVTLYTVMPKTRVDHWLITQNSGEFDKLGSRFGFLPKGYQPESPGNQLAGKHRALFRVLRYELYGAIQLATSLDQFQPDYENVAFNPEQPFSDTDRGPSAFESVPRELSPDLTFEGMHPPTLRPQQLSLDQVADFYSIAGGTPVILVNEPIMILTDVPNSDVRYNAYYPRWIYDQYRQYMGQAAAQNKWNYLDLWDMFSPEFYTNTPLHLNPDGEYQLAKAIAPAMQRACP